MNRVFSVVWNSSLQAWAVASELAPRAGKTATRSVAAGGIAAALLGFAGAAAAACTTSADVITCDTSSTQATTVGAGPGTPLNTSVIVNADAQVSTGNQTAISIGDHSSIVIHDKATVENVALNGSNGFYGTGANTIEMGSNNTLTIAQGAKVLSSGSSGTAEAINPVGSDNLIINNGEIRSSAGGGAFWFEATTGRNTIVNGATGIIAFTGGSDNILGASGTMALDFTNKGQVLGSLTFADGDDRLTIHDGSKITGSIDGGSGNNTLALGGTGVGTFDKAFSNFQTLVKEDSGTWTYKNPLPGSGITSTRVAGGTLVLGLGSNGSAYAGTMTVDAAGTLETPAAFAPLAITDNGLVRFAQPIDASYTGLLSGSGGIEKTGSGTLTLTRDQAITGTTTISAGTLKLGTGVTGGTAGKVDGPIVDNGALVIHRSDAVTFGAPISGSGSVTQLGAGVTTFTADNSYLGGTTIAAGTLQLGNGGFSGGVVGAIVNDAALVINRSNALTLAGTISGSGSVMQRGTGSTTFTADNSYSGGTTIVAGALHLGDGGTTGSVAGNVRNDSMLVLNRSNTLQLAGVISGSGDLLQMGGGTSLLSGANSYSGATTVAAGTLKAGAAGALSMASAHTVAAGATLDTGGFDQGVASLRNAGTVSLIGAAAGSTLTVNGAYVGSGGVLSLGTVLGGSGSLSDRLVLNGVGASASGKTTVRITNLGGLGGLTTGNGIEVVSAVGGATTTAQTTRDAFALANGHVDAGAFEYRLYAADASGAGENWYLRSTTTVSPMPPAVPPVLEDGSTGKTESPVNSVPTYRAEVPLFAALPAQLRQSDLAMLGNLHRRVGDEAAPAAGDPAGGRQAWARAVYSDLDIRQEGPASAQSQGHVSGVQAGTDLLASGGWRAGLYVGTLDGNVNVVGNARGLIASVGSNDLKSRYLGGYATWMDGNGLYADAVLQGGRHSYTVQPYGSLNIDGKASSLTASIETGKAFALGEGWTIEPQAQLIHQSSRFDNVLIGGALVTQDAGDGWIGRLGVRIKGDVMTAAGRLQPYGRLNVYRASSGTDVASFIGPAASTPIASPVGYTSTEVAAGMTLALTSTTTLYGEIGQIYSVSGDAKVQSTLQGSIGMRLRW
ncbi:autotransporter outer membrane beta-barrel domain-containing protein [Variovorax sp. J22P271]|uniref:autotransporter outer membrane beta-barrel domain-containing protein n=1 Tax=Variovorax davisae TaxID=3053515 RepID=UPI00257655DA|nr:autotransporter outer membrane beta-barrel domain-containing protein [Variovorax sp. J22P271]MDM0030792.1 autotransporter outer membrane beta-barrel domain-containing protein [Variovorax sp. J22P271]